MRQRLGENVLVAAWFCAAAILAALPALAADTPPAADQTAPLVVAVIPVASALEWSGPRPTGVLVDVWDEMAGQLGLKTRFERVNTLSGLIEMLTSGRVDLALGPLAITEERERTIDLTHPIFHSGLRIAVRQRTETGFLPAVRSLLSWQLLGVLGGVLVLALVSGHLLWWLERRHNPHSFPAAYSRGVWEAVWWIASTSVSGGCDDKHVDGVAGRALAFAWMIGGIVLVAAFTSALTATMTAERVTGAIHSARDLSGRTIGCQKGAVSVMSIRQRGGNVEQYLTLPEALDALTLGMVEAVVAENQTLMHLVNDRKRRDIRLVGPLFDSFDFGLGLPSNSPLREDLNTIILRMREDGTMERLQEQWLGRHD
jgi:ABC-type amino acid transport substrate-binding protein